MIMAEKKLTRISFLRGAYLNDPNMSNDKALSILKERFPSTKANSKSITTWKKMFRDEGIKIPRQKVGAKPKSKKARVK